MTAIEELSSKRLCFSVTSGRSRTKLLATLLRDCSGILAEHEPAPRFNYVLRSILECPEAAQWWLATEKLTAIAEQVRGRDTYAELSHLTCKAFIEPLLGLGLRPAFLIVSRPAREVATSLFKIGAVPERTGAGRLVLIGPQHSPFLPLPEWRDLSDYQLCYWYAREIEFRQEHYRTFFAERGLEWRNCTVDDMTGWEAFRALSAFVSPSAAEPNKVRFDEILSRDQNPRQALIEGGAESAVPLDLHAEEAAVERRIADLRADG